MILRTAIVPTPVGDAWLCTTEHGVCALGVGPRAEALLAARVRARFGDARLEPARDPDGVASRIAAYFAGARALDDLAVDLGGTPFQARVWRALRALPLGARASYAELAARIGAPRAVRAVGSANGANPVALVVPCHRVVGADGALRGYAWGEPVKRWLLAHEARWSAAPRDAPTRAPHVTSSSPT